MDSRYIFYIDKNNPTRIGTEYLNVTNLEYIKEYNLNFFHIFDLIFNIEKWDVGYYDDITLSPDILNFLEKDKCTLIINISYECTGYKEDFFVSYIKNFIKKYNFTFLICKLKL